MKNDDLPDREDRLTALRAYFPELKIVGKGSEQVVVANPLYKDMVDSYIHLRYQNPHCLAQHLITYHVHEIVNTLYPRIVSRFQYTDTRELKTRREFITGTRPSQKQVDAWFDKIEDIFNSTGKLLPVGDQYIGNFILNDKGIVVFFDRLSFGGDLLKLNDEPFVKYCRKKRLSPIKTKKILHHVDRIRELQAVEYLLSSIYNYQHGYMNPDIQRAIANSGVYSRQYKNFTSKARQRIARQTEALYQVHLQYHRDQSSF